MHILKPFTREFKPLVELVDRVHTLPITLGVFLDLNPGWFAAYRLDRAGIRIDRIHEYSYALLNSILGSPFLENYLDLGWRGPSDDNPWFFGSMANKEYQPFLAKVIARPMASIDDRKYREELVRLVRDGMFPAIIETREPAQLALAPGDECLSIGGPGTIGGFLKDRKSSRIYAVTCGHVAGQGQAVNVAGKPIGTCTHAIAPIASFGCTHSGNNNNVDVALVDIGQASFANAVSVHAKGIISFQPIKMTGGKSGPQNYQIGGTGFSYPLSQTYCFDGLFEVLPIVPAPLFFGPRIAAAMAPVPVGGDSGSWIETVSSPNEWCGMLVGAGRVGYAVEADTILSETNRQCGLDLVVA